ncbi:AraC family transcriptional regulator [Flavobacterium album]|uniref:AraC family transcriptional regulator n=1 Tax=Flavobacterium album TaxID=2175091 RepID=A0A2S1QTT5_9FLAO|nr:response regulator transcription factor [Flavobacterium album]AWH83837.1 AraC family transcriptional regulator [Flavobacterium album]
MKPTAQSPIHIDSVSEMHRFLNLPGPEHPLISMISFKDVEPELNEWGRGMIINLYIIAIKKEFTGKVRYGQGYYDFDEGMMSFIAPGQLCYQSGPGENPRGGQMLIFHPDFLRSYPLGKKIKEYEFFSYDVTEALYLSQKEESMIEGIMKNIEQEYHSTMDGFSHDLIMSHIELLLNYSNRFYNRQFMTRKVAHNDLLVKLERVFEEHFSSENKTAALPTVKDIAAKLNVSPGYLSDMLRTYTGQNAQQHIHNKLIEKAKEILTTTPLSVSEIAFQLGFEYPQSFSKLFKSKTNVSPLEFRKLFN